MQHRNQPGRVHGVSKARDPAANMLLCCVWMLQACPSATSMHASTVQLCLKHPVSSLRGLHNSWVPSSSASAVKQQFTDDGIYDMPKRASSDDEKHLPEPKNEGAKGDGLLLTLSAG